MKARRHEGDSVLEGRRDNVAKESRILLVIGGFWIGGAERQTVLLARELQASGVEVGVLGTDRGSEVARRCAALGIPCRQLHFPWSQGRVRRLIAAAQFVRMVRRMRPDVIVSFTMRPNILCGLTWRLTGARAMVWNQRDEGRERFHGALERRAVGAATRFIANAGVGRDFLIQELGVKPLHVDVVWNGVDVGPGVEGRDQWRRRRSIPCDRHVVAMVANLQHMKDHLTLIAAWRILLDDLPEPQPILALVGKPVDTAAQLETKVQELGLGSSVRFLGFEEDVASALGAVDLIVHSSQCEGMPNAVMEAMMAGLPVVGTDIPGIREALGPSSEDALVPKASPQMLAQTLRRFLLDSDLRHAHAEQNRARARRCFSVEAMVGQTLGVISRALAS